MKEAHQCRTESEGSQNPPGPELMCPNPSPACSVDISLWIGWKVRVSRRTGKKHPRFYNIKETNDVSPLILTDVRSPEGRLVSEQSKNEYDNVVELRRPHKRKSTAERNTMTKPRPAKKPK